MPEEKKKKKIAKKEGGDKLKKTVTRKTRPVKRASPRAKKDEPKKAARPKRRKAPAPKASKEVKKPPVKEAAPPEEKEEIREITRINLAELEERTYSTEDFQDQLEMYEKTMGEMREGEIIKGKVMGVTKDDVIVDVGFKSEGIIPIIEFPHPLNIKVGDEIEILPAETLILLIDHGKIKRNAKGNPGILEDRVCSIFQALYRFHRSHILYP